MNEFVYSIIEAILLLFALRGRRWAMMVMAFSLPFARRLPSLPLPLLNYENLIFGAAIIAYLMHPPGKGAPGGRVRYALPVGTLVLFFTASFVNTITTFTPVRFYRLWNPYDNMMQFKALVMCFALYVLGSLAIHSREDLITVFRAGVAGILVETGYTAYEWVILRPGRTTGHMGEPNSMGAYLAASFCLLVALMLTLPRSHRLRWFAAAGSVCAALGLLGTLSRGAYVAAAGGVLFLTALVNRRALAFGLVVLALNALWLPESVQKRFQDTFIEEEQENYRFREGKGGDASALIEMINEELEEEAATTEGEAVTRLDSSVQTRLVTWAAALQIIRDYPLGVGFGVFPWYLQFYSTVVMWKATHNIYLKIATEAGLPALLIFLYLIYGFARDSWRTWRDNDDPEIRAYGIGMLASLIALCLNAMTVDLFFQIEVNGQLWLLLGVLMQAPLVAGRRVPAGSELPAGPRSDHPVYELVR